MIKVSENKQSGFTLLEIILTLVIGAVVAATFVGYLGTAFTKSSIPIQRLRQAFELQQVMENITEDYRENYTSDLSVSTGLSGEIGDPKYGTYNVVDNYFIWFDDDNDNEEIIDTATQTFLKVTIKSELGGILTTLFSEQ